MSDRPLYYPVWIASGREDNPISWGKPCATPAEAAAILRQKIADEGASLGVIVKMNAAGKEALETSILPVAARRAIRHYLDILDALENDPC